MHHNRGTAPFDVTQGRATLDAVDKTALRRRVRQQRAQRGHRGAGDRIAAGLQEVRSAFGAQAPRLLAGFLPLPGEPDVRNCLEQSWRRGERVVVPRTLPECRMEWVGWSPAVELQQDRHGLWAPAGPPEPDALTAAPDPAAVVLVPALAADRTGMRLGHGAGYYDRALADLPRWPLGPLRVAVVHPDEVLAEPLPREPHDALVDAVLTADGWTRIAR